MTTRVIRTPYDLQQLSAFLTARGLPCTVTIAQGVLRTNPQNKIQRKWCTEVAEQFGDRTPERVRGEAKLTFGVPILRAEDAIFCEKYDRIIKPLPYETKVELMMEPFDFPVTRLMTTKQKTAYLDAFAAYYARQGVRLTIPEAA